MEMLTNSRMEKFCQIMALEATDASEACFRAGYGQPSHPIKDSYHAMQGARLMERKEVVLRIETIRKDNVDKDVNFQGTVIDFLKKAAFYDPTKYMKVYQTTMENGRVAQDTVIREKDFTKWDSIDKKMIDHFDSRTGNPVFIDKTWAFEKLLKIYNMDGKAPLDIEDIMSLFMGAGLPVGSKAPSNQAKTDQTTDADLGDEYDDLDEE